MKKELDFEKFSTLIIDEIHAVEDRANVRMDRFEGRMDKMEIDISEIKDELRGIRQELRDINRRLDTLEERVGWMSGYAKEIDDLRARVKVLESYMSGRTHAAA